MSSTRINGSATACLALLLLGTGCAKLPLENAAPGTPILSSTGERTALGVACTVLVDDPDGDRVTIRFTATPEGGLAQASVWSAFITSGRPTEFQLDLGDGVWHVSAVARDELEEESPRGHLDVTVAPAQSP